jgi:hypothetical protein
MDGRFLSCLESRPLCELCLGDMCWAVWWCDSVLDLALSPALSLGGEWLGDLLGGEDGLLQLGELLGGGEGLLLGGGDGLLQLGDLGGGEALLGVAGDGLLRLGDLLGGGDGLLQLGDLLGGGEGLRWLDVATLPQPAPLSALAFLATGLGLSLQGLLQPVLPSFQLLLYAGLEGLAQSFFQSFFSLLWSFLAVLSFSMTPRYLLTSSSGTRSMNRLMSCLKPPLSYAWSSLGLRFLMKTTSGCCGDGGL